MVKEFLEQMTKMIKSMNRQNGWKYSCMEEFVLENGKLSTDVAGKVKRGKMKECFKNAFQLADRYEDELTYVEGFAVSKGVPLHVLHAWCVDKQKKVHDPTWKDGAEYFGVEFDLMYVRKVIVQRKHYGVIDNWEGQWPLLRGERYE